MLYDIRNSRDFVLGVVSYLVDKYEMQIVIDYIKQHENVTTSELLLLALSNDKDRADDYVIEPNFALEIEQKKKQNSIVIALYKRHKFSQQGVFLCEFFWGNNAFYQ